VADNNNFDEKPGKWRGIHNPLRSEALVKVHDAMVGVGIK